MKAEKQKILIVDDERFNINILADILGTDYDIVIAKNGQQALKRAMSKKPPNLILLDIIMPEMDGYEVCRRLKEDEKTRDIPVIFITAMSEVDDEYRGLEMGAIDYITKPFKLPIVKARVKNHLKLQTAMLEVEAANKAKSAFIAEMSHEIRTPINAIMGFAEILENRINDKQSKWYLNAIISSGKTLLRLINDILDLSTVESGKLRLEYTPLKLRSVFEEMKTVFFRKITDKGLEFKLQIDPGLPEIIMIDETRLRQIVLNIVGNAVKFTETGYIKISIMPLFPNKSSELIDLVITVEDTGIGISRDQRETIFEAFEQQKGQSITRFGGTGLGLAITKRLVRMMGGEISVRGEEGAGSTFIVIIRGVKIASDIDLAQQEKKNLKYESVFFEKAKILIVDDAQLNIILLKGYLEDSNLTIIEAGNGREAIDQARLHHPDVILTDIRMPVMNGYEATKIMKKDEELKEIPIIAVTASVVKNAEEEAKKVYDAYINKPVTKIKLIRELTRFLKYTVRKSG